MLNTRETLLLDLPHRDKSQQDRRIQAAQSKRGSGGYEFPGQHFAQLLLLASPIGPPKHGI